AIENLEDVWINIAARNRMLRAFEFRWFHRKVTRTARRCGHDTVQQSSTSARGLHRGSLGFCGYHTIDPYVETRRSDRAYCESWSFVPRWGHGGRGDPALLRDRACPYGGRG